MAAYDVRTIDMTMPLALRYMGQEREGIQERLNEMINQYVHELDGILIKWSDMTIGEGVISGDQPYTFWKVQFQAQTFKPTDGKVVQGRVHRMLKNYFIGTALDSINVTVSIPDHLINDDIVKNLTVQQDVFFKIKGSAEGSYKGEFDEECIKLTEIHLKEEAEKSAGDVYSYAKDFEY